VYNDLIGDARSYVCFSNLGMISYDRYIPQLFLPKVIVGYFILPKVRLPKSIIFLVFILFSWKAKGISTQSGLLGRYSSFFPYYIVSAVFACILYYVLVLFLSVFFFKLKIVLLFTRVPL
jgi:hypothetical protein